MEADALPASSRGSLGLGLFAGLRRGAAGRGVGARAGARGDR